MSAMEGLVFLCFEPLWIVVWLSTLAYGITKTVGTSYLRLRVSLFLFGLVPSLDFLLFSLCFSGSHCASTTNSEIPNLKPFEESCTCQTVYPKPWFSICRTR